MFLVVLSIDCICFFFDLNYKMVIFLSQTYSTPNFFKKNTDFSDSETDMS
jgi:hypothetical protein